MDDRAGDLEGIGGQRVRGRREAAQHPRMATAPDEEPDRLPGLRDRARGGSQGFLDGRFTLESIWPRAQDVEARRPATNARTLSFIAVGARAAPRACQVLESTLGRRGPVATRLDHVEHHLHARPDALDEIGLGDEVGAVGNVHRVSRRARDGRRHQDGECEHARQQQGEASPGRGPRRSRHHVNDTTGRQDRFPRPARRPSSVAACAAALVAPRGSPRPCGRRASSRPPAARTSRTSSRPSLSTINPSGAQDARSSRVESGRWEGLRPSASVPTRLASGSRERDRHPQRSQPRRASWDVRRAWVARCRPGARPALPRRRPSQIASIRRGASRGP